MSAECRPPPPEYYPDQKAAYPSPQLLQDKDAPPPYQYQQQHKTASKTVVITSQPTRTPRVTRVQVQPGSNNVLMLSIGLTTMFLVCGFWYPLCCSVPAICLAVSAKNAEASGNSQLAKSRKMYARGCNIASLMWWVMGLGILIGVAVAVTGDTEQQFELIIDR